MKLHRVTLKNFRCFTDITLSFQEHLSILEGKNGAGKTSIFEALYYACYLRSFRTHIPRELIHFNRADYFFIHVDFEDKQGSAHTIQIGASSHEKVIKLDGKPIKSHKEILRYYKVILCSENDLDLIQGGPEVRRAFIDQSLIISHESYAGVLKSYRSILHNRNQLLKIKPSTFAAGSYESQLYTWSEQLWRTSKHLITLRKTYLAALEATSNELLRTHFQPLETLSLKLSYQEKGGYDQCTSFQAFWPSYREQSVVKEQALERTLFGAHLDDITIELSKVNTRSFASRGQQKLVVFIIKIAQLSLLDQQGYDCCLLLDDFLTDFDAERFKQCMSLLKALTMPCHIVISSPLFSLIEPNVTDHPLHLISL